MGANNRSADEIWGAAPVVESDALQTAVRELQTDLQSLVDELRVGPVAKIRREVEDYLAELRREFLRAHRRVQVQVRTAESRQAAPDTLRRELAEVAARFRTVVLSRSSRVQHRGWSPLSLSTALHRVVDRLPRLVSAPYEERTWTRQPDDGVTKRLRRWLIRVARWLRRSTGMAPARRTIELNELGRYHFDGRAASQLEGLAALFVQSEVQLAGRSRQLLEAVARGFEALVSNAEQDDLADIVDGMKIQFEDEFGSIDRDVGQMLDDGVRRAETIFGDALRALKGELPIIATFDLSSRRRRAVAAVPDSQRQLKEMASRLDELRAQVAAGYVLLALHLEFIGFRARMQQTMDEVLSDLGADVRGRSKVQLERVRQALDEVLEGLANLDRTGSGVDETVRATVQPLEFVVEEAAGVTRQLLEQLSAEAAVTPLLDALNRAAQSLTVRYQVPQAPIPRTEWKLPAAVAIIEVNFADVVSSFVQREIAPELLTITNRTMDQVVPILDTFQDLQRIVTFNADAIDDQIDLRSASAAAGEQLADIVQATLRHSRDGLTGRLTETAHWDEDLVENIRNRVATKLDELRRRLGEGDIGQAQAVLRRSESGFEWRGQVDEIAGGVWRRGTETGAWLRRRIGGDRLAAWRERLGLPGSDERPPADASAWPPPQRSSEIPVFYSRLFATQARWAGDVINVPEDDLTRAREVLSSAKGGGRTVALVGADAAGRGALVGAVLRGSKTVRRIAFSHPTSAAQLRASLAEVNSGVTVQLSGLSWLISARPGGVEPLRVLLELVAKEQRRIGWLLEADELVWDFAASVSALSDIFMTQVRLPRLTPAGLEQAILARHQLSGYGLRFSVGESSAADDRTATREQFFRSLYAASGGLLQVALPMWLGAVGKVVEDSSTVVVTEMPRSASAALRRLPDEVWRVMFVTARQGWMDGTTLASALQLDSATADGRLSGLVRLGLLERQGREAYVIRRHLRGAVLRGLKDEGWLV